MTTNQITEIINTSDSWKFGIRILHSDETPAIGDEMPESFIWVDGDRTEEGIGGTCAFVISEVDGWRVDAALKNAGSYNVGGPERYALLGGKYTGNNDLIAEADTVAIRDAVVLAVWEV